MRPEQRTGELELASPHLGEALNRVVDAGERLAQHRLELALVELRQTISALQIPATATLGAAILVVCGWVFVAIGAMRWLAELWPPFAAALAVGVAQFAIAALLFGWQRRALRRMAQEKTRTRP
jgi:uncharacterized membrane protein YqjE